MTSRSAEFFENGTNKQFEWVLSKYQEALQAKAESKSSKSETLLKLDKWYQNDLPKKIKSRGKEAHLTHEEMVQTIKWKLARGVFRPRLKDLITMNTPRVVMQETKKAFRTLEKRNDLEAAIGALSNLKGVGPAMASAVLAAGAPEVAPFMADECLLSMPEVEGIDYTMKEYMKLVDKTNQCVERLNAQGGSWTPHKVELAVWTQYVCRDLKPELLDGMPERNERVAEPTENGVNGDDTNSVVSNGDTNGSTESEREDTPEEEDTATNGGFANGDPVYENGDRGQHNYQENYQSYLNNTSVETPGESHKRPFEDHEAVENGANSVEPDSKKVREEQHEESVENISCHESTNGVGEQQQQQAIMSGGD